MKNNTQHTWKDFFDEIAPVYENECFTRNTAAEVDFIEAELCLKRGASILDIGCGTGRHSIELARRGYQVTGVDISGGMLEVARQNAQERGVMADFIECAAQEFVASRPFDAVISLCEGALCLFSDDDDIWKKDMAIFAGIAESLLPGRPFLVTVLSAFRLLRSLSDSDVEAGGADLQTLTTRCVNEVEMNGRKIQVRGIERYYTPPEIFRMVNRVGLKVDKIYGGTAGNWRRGVISLDEYEFMVVGHRKTTAV